MNLRQLQLQTGQSDTHQWTFETEEQLAHTWVELLLNSLAKLVMVVTITPASFWEKVVTEPLNTPTTRRWMARKQMFINDPQMWAPLLTWNCRMKRWICSLTSSEPSSSSSDEEEAILARILGRLWGHWEMLIVSRCDKPSRHKAETDFPFTMKSMGRLPINHICYLSLFLSPYTLGYSSLSPIFFHFYPLFSNFFFPS